MAGEPIRGSWWGTQKGARNLPGNSHRTRLRSGSCVCLVSGKITYVHRRLWPGLANSLDKKTLAALREEHTPSGAHRVRTIPFPRWVPPEVRQAAENISEEEAHLQLGDWIRRYLRKGHRSAS